MRRSMIDWARGVRWRRGRPGERAMNVAMPRRRRPLATTGSTPAVARSLLLLASDAGVAGPQPPGTPPAERCAARLTVADTLSFDRTSLTVSRACPRFTVRLDHVGKLPTQAMGHSWVLVQAADAAAVAADGLAAGPTKDNLAPRDPRVLAATRVIGPGESTSVDLPLGTLRVGERYTYVCTFPGHHALMQGSLTVTP